ncbi:hypothetical protein GCM10007377_16900 [Galliscardovia ingluviei]|uniref:Uncharacterized protein n=1 Tax=Galliscardovia ingluviei TaxID=1769422 RepID=A0A8J3AKQ1_9BIFI|nr:Imm50 family immunity protein [Galliscardovia ingluviei]GGI15640.1 hypothetical protein GCM10007377_16900 [Galliscardovia ingluviei]
MWYEVTGRNSFLERLFDKIPPLEDFWVTELNIRSGQYVEVFFTSKNTVDHIPAKWERDCRTHANIVLRFEHMFLCEYIDQCSGVNGIAQIEQVDDLVVCCKITSSNFRVKILSMYVSIGHVYGSRI